MNFLLQLTDDELLKLHRYAVYDDIKDIVEKQVDYNNSVLTLTFYENLVDEDGTPRYLDTNYTYDDFNGVTSHDTYDDDDCSHSFRLFMLEKFGYDYLQQLVQHKFGISKYWFEVGLRKVD